MFILEALASAFDMLWQVFWPLVLGFLLSAVVQSLVSLRTVAAALGDASPRSLGIACLVGAASSPCSYAADASALWLDIGLGLLIAGALAAWVPDSFWRGFFLTGHPRLAFVWGPLVGPLISMVSFVCSVGNVPLAVVLWNGGISFGGVIAFIFADLIILPILDIYRKYYGLRVGLYLLAVSYVAMVAAGMAIELLFQVLGLVPSDHHVTA